MELSAVGLAPRRRADLVVVGGGPAGATAALYAARADLDVLVVDRGITAGALGKTGMVANFPGLPPMPGAEVVALLRRQAEQFGARFVQGQATGLEARDGQLRLQTSLGEIEAQGVVVATGSMGREPSIPGEAEFLGRGVSYCATCDGAFFRGEVVAVAGRSDEAAAEAAFLSHQAARVEVVVPGDVPDEPAWRALLERDNVRLHPRHSLKAIEGDTGGVSGVRLRGLGGERELPAQGVFLYLQGQRPITDWLRETLPVAEDGCVAVGADQQTALPGVFAAGDVLCTGVKQAVIASAQGAAAAMEAERRLRGRRAARPDWR